MFSPSSWSEWLVVVMRDPRVQETTRLIAQPIVNELKVYVYATVILVFLIFALLLILLLVLIWSLSAHAKHADVIGKGGTPTPPLINPPLS